MKSHTLTEFLQHLFEQVSQVVDSPSVLRYLQLVFKTNVPNDKKAPRLTSSKSRIPLPTKSTPRVQDTVISGRIAKKWPRSAKAASPKGLYNPKNNCYRNAMLQCLLHLPELIHYLDSIHAPWQCPKTARSCVVCALKELVQEYSSGQQKALSSKSPHVELQRFNRVVKRTVPRGHDMEEDIKLNLQSDPYDFLKYLYEQIEQVELPGDDYKLTDLFTIEHETQWTCEDCGNVSSRAEASAESGHGIGLSVNIQQPDAGLSMLRYLRENEYEEELQIMCESKECVKKYGKKGDSPTRIRKKVITKAPEVLIVRLVRFAKEWDDVAKDLVDYKLTGEAAFEEYLNLAEFTASEDVPLLYKLQGVVAHSGEDIAGGHYIAAVRQRNGKMFCTINDDCLIAKERGGTVEELEFPLSENVDYDPYVLIYSRI